MDVKQDKSKETVLLRGMYLDLPRDMTWIENVGQQVDITQESYQSRKRIVRNKSGERSTGRPSKRWKAVTGHIPIP